MSLRPTSFAPDSAEHGRQILDRLVDRFQGQVRRSRATPRRRVYLDTFDWRLWREGSVLLHERSANGGMLRWSMHDGRPRRTTSMAVAPCFAWDLPSGPWRTELDSLIDVRRLLPVARLELEGESLELLDGERKVVARVELAGGEVVAGGDGETRRAMPYRLIVRPLRGYQADARRLREAIESCASRAPDAGNELLLVLETLELSPTVHGGKLRVALEPAMTAGEATGAILGELLDAMLANEPGLRDDLDPEFLHDFRVAVRRARTCLGQLRTTLPRAAGRKLREDLAWLGRATGECRDLDVWLLQLRHDRATLPVAVRDDLIPLRDHLRARRVTVRERLLADLDSKRYRTLVRRWERLAASGNEATGPGAPDGARPVGSVAAERIARRAERLIARGRAIDERSPDEALHELRIDGKKLRYLFEFYRALLDARRLGQVLSRLKGLQDVLGEFNDLSVQRASLERFAAELADGGLREPGPLMTIGRLTARFDTLAIERRRQFAERFARFAAPKNARRMERLLAPLASDPSEP